MIPASEQTYLGQWVATCEGCYDGATDSDNDAMGHGATRAEAIANLTAVATCDCKNGETNNE